MGGASSTGFLGSKLPDAVDMVLLACVALDWAGGCDAVGLSGLGDEVEVFECVGGAACV